MVEVITMGASVKRLILESMYFLFVYVLYYRVSGCLIKLLILLIWLWDFSSHVQLLNCAL
jgi:hypothetical protein